jgi:hypothetical protein
MCGVGDHLIKGVSAMKKKLDVCKLLNSLLDELDPNELHELIDLLKRLQDVLMNTFIVLTAPTLHKIVKQKLKEYDAAHH